MNKKPSRDGFLLGTWLQQALAPAWEEGWRFRSWKFGMMIFC